MDEATYQARVDEFLAFATSVDHSSNPSGINAHLGRAHRGPDYVWNIDDVTVESLGAVFEQIDAWEDTRDFQLMYLHWMLALGQGDTPMTQLSPDVVAAIHERMLANRYRYDDPLPADRLDNLWFWSENHRIINLAIEYLLRPALPRRDLRRHGSHRRRTSRGGLHPRHRRLDHRARRSRASSSGTPTSTCSRTSRALRDASPSSPTIPRSSPQRRWPLDLCLVDMAAHNHSGGYTAPWGRTYKKDKMTSLDEDTFFGTARVRVRRHQRGLRVRHSATR